MLVLGVAIATVAAFIISSVYYTLAPARTVNGQPAPRPQPWQIVLELVRSALVAGLVAGLMVAAGWHGPVQGLLLGLALFIVPAVILAGSVQWEGVPVRTALLHVGDWLVKLAGIGVIIGVFA